MIKVQSFVNVKKSIFLFSQIHVRVIVANGRVVKAVPQTVHTFECPKVLPCGGGRDCHSTAFAIAKPHLAETAH
jgi:hypothetical protein